MFIIFLVFWTNLIFVLGFFLALRLKRRSGRNLAKLEKLIFQTNSDGYDEELYKIDHDRYSEWVKASIAWIINPQKVSSIIHHIQLLGIVDARLYRRKVQDYFINGKSICDNNGVMLSERDAILADLWILGSYEFIRTVDQRYRGKDGKKIGEAKKIIRQTLELFRRVRIPVAKSEAVIERKGIDDISAPVGCAEKGFGWQLNKDTIVWQRELSDNFLNMLRTVKPGWLLEEEPDQKYDYEDEQGKGILKKPDEQDK